MTSRLRKWAISGGVQEEPEGKTSAVGVELTTLHGAVLLDIAAEQSETVSNKMSV